MKEFEKEMEELKCYLEDDDEEKLESSCKERKLRCPY